MLGPLECVLYNSTAAASSTTVKVTSSSAPQPSSIHAVVGIAVGCVVAGLAVIATTTYLFVRRRRANRVRMLDLGETDDVPDFDTLRRPPPQVDALKLSPSENGPAEGVLLSLGRLGKRMIGRHEQTAEQGWERGVVYHLDGGEFHVPPSYSEITKPQGSELQVDPDHSRQ